ncbi:hypothetical protein NC652_011611 [Populus alba x Populus x berolinensis]|nr:hypothetical protein NC652_011611 [Populus alba x Populus x berolinensis]
MAACCCPLIMGILCFQQRKGSRLKLHAETKRRRRLQANTQADTSASQAVVYLYTFMPLYLGTHGESTGWSKWEKALHRGRRRILLNCNWTGSNPFFENEI